MTATKRALAEISRPPTQEAWRAHVASFVRPDDPGTDDLEWSGLGRSPRYLPGWWIIPALLFDVVLIGGAVWWLT